jgi:hypothetical protein
MEEKVALEDVDVDAGLKIKYSELVMDAGESALRILLMNHVMERKHLHLEKKHKDAAEDAEKWQHQASGLQIRLSKALESKKVAEKASKNLETKLATSNCEKEMRKKFRTGGRGEDV